MVLCGFLACGFLIQSAYREWQDFPVASTITTHPLSGLDFPSVTVCPPRGYTTPLNYDLAKAEEDSLTQEDREQFKKTVGEAFLESPHWDFIGRMKDVVNEGNIELVYDGFQVFPQTLDGGRWGYGTALWTRNGAIQTQKFQQPFDQEFLKRHQISFFRLGLPLNIADQVGKGELVIDFEIDARIEDGWNEVITIKIGGAQVPALVLGRYSIYNDPKTFEEADAFCASNGGRLSPVLTDADQGSVGTAVNWLQNGLWLGGKSQGSGWVWLDGSPWGYTNWQGQEGSFDNGKNCMGIFDPTLQWKQMDCSNKAAFACTQENYFKGQNLTTLRYKAEDIKFSTLEANYRYQFANKGLLNLGKDKPIPGMRMSWRIEDRYPDLYLQTGDIGSTIRTPGWGAHNTDAEFYKHDHSYTASLMTPQSLATELGSRSLEVILDVDTRDTKEYVEVKIARENGTFIKQFKGNDSLVLSFNSVDLDFNSIIVTWKYEFSDQTNLSSWEGNTMTGFSVQWTIKGSNETQLTSDVWKPLSADPLCNNLGYTCTPEFIKVVKIVADSKAVMPKNELMATVIKDKANFFRQIIEQDILPRMCSNGILTKKALTHFLRTLPTYEQTDNTEPSTEDIITEPSSEDITTGFELYSAIIYCSEENLKLYKFFHSVVSANTPRTIIQSVVNTISYSKIVEPRNKKRLNALYQKLNRHFDLQIGNILAITAGVADLQYMDYKDMPFLDNFTLWSSIVSAGDLSKVIGSYIVQLIPSPVPPR